MDNQERYCTLSEVRVKKMWGLCAGSYVYEGCGLLLSDGRPCSLGKHKRKLRRKDPESPLGPHSRIRDGHTCSLDGAGTYMFCFAIQVGETVIQVNKSCGMQLVGMLGQRFYEACGSDEDHGEEALNEVLRLVWTILYARDDCLPNICRALIVMKCSQSEPVDVGDGDGDGLLGKSLSQLKGKVLEFLEDVLSSLKSFRIAD